MKRTVEDFLSDFALPLVQGGELKVGSPVSEPELRLFIDGLAHASVASSAVDDARARVVQELVVRAPPMILDDDELYLTAALHNLLFLAHPDIDAWTVTRGMERRVLDTAMAFSKRPLSRDRRRVLARHALLHNVFAISRTDITVRWWTGRATFEGQAPPKRLTSWKGLRRVTEERTLADFTELLGTEHVAPIVYALIRRSPLTILLHPQRFGAGLLWEELVFLLRDAELARAVAYRCIGGTDADGVVAQPACFAVAFEQMLERRPSAADVRAVAAFLVHLNALLAMSEADARDRQRSALLNQVLAPEKAGARPKGLATFFALPAALASVDRQLCEPPGLDSDPRLRERWRQHRKQVQLEVGDAFIDHLASKLARHVQRAA